ncbi:hypothetical protein Cch01nite_18520 [Cellulomonas chitinilytica]|uniref:Uncharacterized protein n=2 Tax=Cellulomonas chitinilytica TaxID=398759 RepID=A0A919TZR8_9CELL|nr:hypothetical protein Cch01nite_18520 [Cellulomonas chitinilytica]
MARDTQAMRIASGPSWSLELGDDPFLSAALWIRDATGIVVEADDVPPPLNVPPPSSHVLDGEDLDGVGGDWLDWWRALLAARLAQRHNPPPGGDFGEEWKQWAVTNQARWAAVGSIGDEFAGLAHAPALQRACRELGRAAHGARTTSKIQHDRAMGYGLLVDEVAATHHVDRNTLCGTVIVTPTGGGWWRLIEPGFVLASNDAPHQEIVRAALTPAP